MMSARRQCMLYRHRWGYGYGYVSVIQGRGNGSHVNKPTLSIAAAVKAGQSLQQTTFNNSSSGSTSTGLTSASPVSAGPTSAGCVLSVVVRACRICDMGIELMNSVLPSGPMRLRHQQRTPHPPHRQPHCFHKARRRRHWLLSLGQSACLPTHQRCHPLHLSNLTWSHTLTLLLPLLMSNSPSLPPQVCHWCSDQPLELSFLS